ncbi:MAG: hypothetical protein WBG71_01355 [Leeuwenhoekiella sp.]
MTTKVHSILECERKSLKKFTKYQLPHKFKKIGFVIFAVSFLSVFVIGFATEGASFEEIGKRVSKLGILIGLLIISISKEQIEDERVISLRMQSYAFAFIWAVIVSLVFPFVNYVVDAAFLEKTALQDTGDFFVLWMLLAVQVAFFHVLRKSHS